MDRYIVQISGPNALATANELANSLKGDTNLPGLRVIVRRPTGRPTSRDPKCRRFTVANFGDGVVIITAITAAAAVAIPLVMAIGNAIQRAAERGQSITLSASFGPAAAKLALHEGAAPSKTEKSRQA